MPGYEGTNLPQRLALLSAALYYDTQLIQGPGGFAGIPGRNA
jgi:hypothetical protein